MIKQENIDHRTFVDDEQIAAERIVFVSSKIHTHTRNKTVFQQTMDGLGFATGDFTQTFGCSAGGCCQEDFGLLPLIQQRKCANNGGFTGAGTACNHGNVILSGLVVKLLNLTLWQNESLNSLPKGRMCNRYCSCQASSPVKVCWLLYTGNQPLQRWAARLSA
jgi:hypothetical protein